MALLASSRVWAVCFFISVGLIAVFLLACSKVPENTIANRPEPTAAELRTYEILVREGRGAFLKEPRDNETVEISAQKYKEAIAIRSDEYEVLWEAARSCIWLGYFGPEAKRKEYVNQGVQYGNTAVKIKPEGEQGLFYRGALAGRMADLDFTYGADAVKIIEGDMLHLVENKSTYIYGGPDRVLAILYMRAPGSPLSVGDYDKALAHMKRALEIMPQWPENQLYMAELEFRLGKKNSDAALAESAKKRLQEYFLKDDAKPTMAMSMDYEFKAWKQDAAKLVEEYK